MTTIEKRANDAIQSMEYAANIAEQFVDSENFSDIKTKKGIVKPLSVSVKRINDLSSSVSASIDDLELSANDRISKIAHFSKEVFSPGTVYSDKCFFEYGGTAYTPMSYPYVAGVTVLADNDLGKLTVLQGVSSTDLGDSPFQIPSNKKINFRAFKCLSDAVDFVSLNPDSITLLKVLSRRSLSECAADGVNYPDDGAADYKVVDSGIADNFEFISAGSKLLQIDVGSSSPKISQFGAVSDPNYDNKDVFLRAEQSRFTDFDLSGAVYDASVNPVLLKKNYRSGNVVGINASGNREVLGNLDRLATASGPRLKSGVVDWAGKTVLWLGTSIPHQGHGVDGYPEQFGDHFGCDVINMAWSSSHATFNPADSAFQLGTINSLSMTEQDRLNGLELHGAGSAYDPDFDAITKAHKMTADARIREQFQHHQIDAVMLDHNHNDRRNEFGDLELVSIPITGITQGVETTISVSDIAGFSPGSAVVLDVSGIPQLQNAAVVIDRVSGNDIVVAIDSSSFSGAFVSGGVSVVDRATIYGAWTFLINYIYWCANEFNQAPPVITLAGAPSEFTRDVRDNSVFSVSLALRKLSSKFKIPFFDVAQSIGIGELDHILYFEDKVHAISPQTRGVIARHWINWAGGGVAPSLSKNQGLLRASRAVFREGVEPVYSEQLNGFHSPADAVGAFSQLINEPFSDGFTGWSIDGSLPVIDQSRLKFDSSAGNTQIYKAAVFDRVIDLSVTVNIQDVVNLVAQGVKGLSLIVIEDSTPIPDGGSGVSVIVQMLCKPDSVELTLKYFGVPVNSGFETVKVVNIRKLRQAVDHRLRLKFQHMTPGTAGVATLYLDDEIIASGKINNVQQPSSNRIKLGIGGSGLDNPMVLRVSDLDVKTAPLVDISNLFTGSLPLLNSKVATVVNGKIVGVV